MAKPVFRILSLVVPCLLLVSAAARATDFYVSPSGNGDGSIGNPWSLDTALSQPSAVHPGDTIWLRGGTYTGIHTSYLNGSSTSPIIVRQYPGERATLDGELRRTRDPLDQRLVRVVLGLRGHELGPGPAFDAVGLVADRHQSRRRRRQRRRRRRGLG